MFTSIPGRVAAALFGAVLAMSATAVAAGTPPARTNVLFIVADDLNTDLGSFGHAVPHTPNIDQLVARGVKFDRAYCQFPLCSPSRESFLSGIRPETSGALAQGVTVRSVRPDAPYLPGYFRAQGYFVGAFGKIFHHNDAASWETYNPAKPISPQERAALKRRGETRERGENGPEWQALDCGDEETGDGIVARGASELLRRAVKDGRPFFIAAGFHKPHLPWTAPRPYFQLYSRSTIPALDEPRMIDIPAIALQTDLTGTPKPEPPAEAVAAYYSCISFVDAQVGLLLKAMDELHLWDSTVVVFLSDHGFHLGDHGGLWGKLSEFEISARVPLAIVAPRNPNAGRTTSRIVELIDLYPTLTELCGLPAPAGLDGRSLAPLLASPDAAWDYPAYTTTIHAATIGRSVRTSRWRYTEWGDGEAVELYDETTDPGEYHNLAADPARAADIAGLKQLLARNPHAKAIPADAQNPRKFKKRNLSAR